MCTLCQQKINIFFLEFYKRSRNVYTMSTNTEKFIGFRADSDLSEKAKARAKSQNRSLAGYMRQLLEDDLDEGGGSSDSVLEPDPDKGNAQSPQPRINAPAPIVPTSGRSSYRNAQPKTKRQ
jgi:hypothetical protein